MNQFTFTEDETSSWNKEDEKHFWSGEGFVTFIVFQNDADNFEIEVLDYDGCVGGMREQWGLDYQIQHIWCNQGDFAEGYIHTLHKMTVIWTRGEFGISDDDVEYDYKSHTKERTGLIEFLKIKLSNFWWRTIGWRLR